MKISPMEVRLVDSMGSDLSVCNAARVSFHKESGWEIIEESILTGNVETKLNEKDQKLISYLAKYGHFTPFCHAFLSFRIKAPIFVARQLVKHQVGLAWNEVSRRYVDEEPEFFWPDVWRGKPLNAKQGSDGAVDLGWLDHDAQYYAMEMTLDVYQKLLGAGVAPEQARTVLPQNTMTEWIWSGSLAAFARVCKLRLDPHAQKETQEVAQLINDCVPQQFKHSWKALLA